MRPSLSCNVPSSMSMSLPRRAYISAGITTVLYTFHLIFTFIFYRTTLQTIHSSYSTRFALCVWHPHSSQFSILRHATSIPAQVCRFQPASLALLPLPIYKWMSAYYCRPYIAPQLNVGLFSLLSTNRQSSLFEHGLLFAIPQGSFLQHYCCMQTACSKGAVC